MNQTVIREPQTCSWDRMICILYCCVTVIQYITVLSGEGAGFLWISLHRRWQSSPTHARDDCLIHCRGSVQGMQGYECEQLPPSHHYEWLFVGHGHSFTVRRGRESASPKLAWFCLIRWSHPASFSNSSPNCSKRLFIFFILSGMDCLTIASAQHRDLILSSSSLSGMTKRNRTNWKRLNPEELRQTMFHLSCVHSWLRRDIYSHTPVYCADCS